MACELMLPHEDNNYVKKHFEPGNLCNIEGTAKFYSRLLTSSKSGWSSIHK